MKIFIFLATMLLYSFNCLAQQTEADSIKNLLQYHAEKDSVRIRLLLDYSNSIVYTEPDSAMKFADEAVLLSKNIQWQKGIKLSLRQKGFVHYQLSDMLKAVDIFQQALKENEASNDQLFEASIFNNLGNVYADLEQYNKAIEYYSKYLDIAKAQNSKADQMKGLLNLGNISVELNDLTKGLNYFNKALALAEELKNKRAILFLMNNIGIVHKRNGNYNEALSHFQQCIKVAREEGNTNIEATALTGIAQVYVLLKQYGKAIEYANQSLELAKKVGALQWQANDYEVLYNAYENSKNFEQALYSYKHYIIARDSIFNDARKGEIVRKEEQFQAEKKQALAKAVYEKNQAVAKAEIKQQKLTRNATIGGAIFILLAAIAGWILYKRKRDAEDQQKDAEFKAMVADTEMKALRSQMNPHFIFNSLNSISDYILKNNIKAADEYLTKFAKVMRMILENSEQKEISLAADLKALELYMQLESLRLTNTFSYEIRVDEDIDQENTLIPPLILQPFVENSIWHGLSKKPGEGKILVLIKKEDNMLSCIVEDNGVGRKAAAEPAANKKSFGMKITKARIDILNKLKKSTAAIHLSVLTEGMRLEVKLPLELMY